jgi:C1A family cysteine protease
MIYLCVLCSCGLINPQGYEERSFISYLRLNGLIYTGEEYYFRLGIYLTNQRYVKEFNHQKQSSFKLGMNHLAAFTQAEYRILLGAKHKSSSIKGSYIQVKKAIKVDTPDYYDWRSEQGGKVYSIKDQGTCSADWAFGAVSAQESAYAIYAKTIPIALSEQNLVDCDFLDYGCDGGNVFNAYDYVIKHQGGNFVAEYSYPYTAVEGTCNYNNAIKNTTMKSYREIYHATEDELLELVYKDGPVACAIDASSSGFQLYWGGVYDDDECRSDIWSLNHEVITIGWGYDENVGKDYWIVRNSWGYYWGEKGYIRMSRNKNNQCGIATELGIPSIA